DPGFQPDAARVDRAAAATTPLTHGAGRRAAGAGPCALRSRRGRREQRSGQDAGRVLPLPPAEYIDAAVDPSGAERGALHTAKMAVSPQAAEPAVTLASTRTIKQDDLIQSIADALQYISYYHPV